MRNTRMRSRVHTLLIKKMSLPPEIWVIILQRLLLDDECSSEHCREYCLSHAAAYTLLSLSRISNYGILCALARIFKRAEYFPVKNVDTYKPLKFHACLVSHTPSPPPVPKITFEPWSFYTKAVIPIKPIRTRDYFIQ